MTRLTATATNDDGKLPRAWWQVAAGELATAYAVGSKLRQALPQRRSKTERQFLRGLWHDLLERTPTYEELRNLRNAMQAMADPAPLRSVLAKVVLDSGKCTLPECTRVSPDSSIS